MAKVNENFLNLPGNYLFAEIARRIREFQGENPQVELIRLGIGDVTRPLVPAVVKAFQEAAGEMGQAATFKGYGPDQGYDFLVEKILEWDYQQLASPPDPDEIFISDGAKCDTGNFQEIFGIDNIVAVTDPVYPVYVDSNVMAGRSGALTAAGQYEKIVYLPCSEATGMKPALPREKVDMIYLCFPNNPTGVTLTKAELREWVDYARSHQAVILYDAAYEAFIQDSDIPRSIYEVDGAREVAVEFRSYSKTAGFTGTRCAYAVVPKLIKVFDSAGKPHSLHGLWQRRQATKFNGVSYPVQRAAAAIYTPEGQEQIKANIAYYMENARIIREGLAVAGFKIFGGTNAPYIWMKTPGEISSWDFFDKLMRDAHVVGTPGSGFGLSGEGYFRLTAFGSQENSRRAVERILNRL